MSKDFIKNNIRYVNKLSSKLRNNKSNNGSVTSRHQNEEPKLSKNASNGNLNTSIRNISRCSTALGQNVVSNKLSRVPSKPGVSVNVSLPKSQA